MFVERGHDGEMPDCEKLESLHSLSPSLHHCVAVSQSVCVCLTLRIAAVGPSEVGKGIGTHCNHGGGV